MRQLHFLRLLANHDQQNAAQQDAGEDQHPAIRQTAVGDKRQNGDDAGKQDSHQDAVSDGLASPSFNLIALQKQHHLKTFPIERCESKQSQTPTTGVCFCAL